jgi:TonB family protein
MKTAMIAALAMLGTLPGPAGASPRGEASSLLAPTGNWNVEYAENMCILSHSFGTGLAEVTLGFRPWPMGERTEVVLISRDSTGTASRFGKGATLSLSSAGPGIEGDYWSFWLPKRKVRLSTLIVDQAALADLGSADSVTIAIPKGARVSVTLPRNTKAALKALDTCDDDLLREWGVDPDEKMKVATPAKALPNVADWISDDDYPPQALRNSQQGTVMILWTIDVDGRVANCIPVIKSGVPLLDQAACNAITLRGRYQPALGKDGKPVSSHNTRRVVWRLPE